MRLGRIVSAAYAVGCIAGLASGCRDGPLAAVTLIPAQMQIAGRHTREPDGGITFWGNGTLQAEVHLEGGPLTITILARGNQLQGEWPKLYVTLDAEVVAGVIIDSNVLTGYSVRVNAPRRGANVLGVALVNYVDVPGQLLAGRNVAVQKIILRPSIQNEGN